MNVWLWLLVGGIICVFIFRKRLDRFFLWLEERGWLFYRNRKPTSGSMSAFVVFHEFIEPGVKQVVEARQEYRQEDANNLRERLLACFRADLIDKEVIRFLLSKAQRAGLDWKKLYEEAVALQQAAQPGSVDLLPSSDDVAPVG